jgi:CheY-like chemotaxis protein
MLARERQRLFVVLADLHGRDALLQPIVACEEQVVDLLTSFVCVHLRIRYASMGSERVRVVIVDDQRLFAEALEAILSTDGRITVVGRAEDGRHAIDLVREHAPDVVLMDIAMPVMDGIEATRAIRDELPGTRVIVVTGSAANADVSRARSAGAAGYVTKDQIAGDLVRAILDAAAA